MRLLFLLFVFTFCCINALIGQNYSTTNSSPKTYVTAVSDNQKGVQDILAMSLDSFALVKDGNVGQGFTKNNVWVRIPLSQPNFYKWLVVENAHIDTLDFYLFSKGELVRSVKTGDLRNFYTRDKNFHFMNVELKSFVDEVVIMAKGNGALTLPLVWLDNEQGYRYFLITDAINWAFLAVLLVILIINLLYFIYLKDKVYLYYFLYLFFLMIFSATDNEYLFQFIFPNHPEINAYNVLFYASYTFFFIFVQKFLKLKTNAPAWNNIFKFLYVLIVTVSMVSIFNYNFSIQVMTLMSMVCPILVLVVCWIVYQKTKNKAYLIYFIGCLFPLLTLVVYALSVVNVVAFTNIWFPVFQAFTVFETLVFMLAVLYDIHLIKDENIRNKSQMVLLLEEKEKMLSTENERLEGMVEVRTKELWDKNNEIQTQMEELRAQKEEISAQWEAMVEQKAEIERVNNELESIKSFLEQEVKKRTKELTESSQTLVLRNQQLEEFTYVVAHNMRGPVASLLGLVNVFKLDKENMGPDALADFFSKSEEMVLRIDSVIKGLMQILQFESGSEGIFTSFPLSPILEDVQVLLKDEIQQSGAQLNISLAQPDIVFGVKVFLNSILYNLLSNAIKYRRKRVSPVISVQTTYGDHQLVIKVTDNGMGMDLEKVGDKIFQLFTTITVDNKGMGLGLYTVRMQVRAMKGTIEVESQVDKGTTFTITLPHLTSWE